MFVIRKLSFCYKVRRIGVSSKEVTILLQEGMACKGFAIKKFAHAVTRRLCVEGICYKGVSHLLWKTFAITEFHVSVT